MKKALVFIIVFGFLSEMPRLLTGQVYVSSGSGSSEHKIGYRVEPQLDRREYKTWEEYIQRNPPIVKRVSFHSIESKGQELRPLPKNESSRNSYDQQRREEYLQHQKNLSRQYCQKSGGNKNHYMRAVILEDRIVYVDDSVPIDFSRCRVVRPPK